MADDEYLPPTHLSRTLGVPLRTLEKWAKGGKIRTRPSPTRRNARLYHRGDVARLAVAQVPPAPTPTLEAPPEPSTEIVPQSELLRMLDDTQRRLDTAMHEAGVWRGRFEQQQKLLEDRDAHQAQTESELDRLRRDMDRLPWWVRWWWLRR